MRETAKSLVLSTTGLNGSESAKDMGRIQKRRESDKRQGTKRWRKRGMSHLVAIAAPVAGSGRREQLPNTGVNQNVCRGICELQLEVTLDEFAKFFAVFVAHMHEFDAASVRADVAHDGGEIDLAKAGTNFKLD
jgi:hypothetical protein